MKSFFFLENSTHNEIVEALDYPVTMSNGESWTSRIGGYETLQELKDKCKILDDPCCICRRLIHVSYCEPIKSELIKNKWCFQCHFWRGYVTQCKNPRIARVNGYHYVINPTANDEARWLGHGGRRFNIEWFDGRKETSNDVWFQGEIPERFKKELPDNARFV